MEEIKMVDIKDLDIERIDARVRELNKELFDLKIKKSTTGMEKPHQLRILKKNIARLKTVRSQTVRGAK